MDVEITVDGTGGLGDALRRGMREGFEKAGDDLLKKGKRDARNIVLGHDRVWNKKVKNGFSTEATKFNRYNHWTGWIRNDAPHAEIVEKGLAPEGEITGSKPSVQDILPWIEDQSITPNSETQAKAEAAHIGNWDVQLQALAVQYGKAQVIMAFAIAESIKNDGYPGIYFMEKTESKLQSQAVNVRNTVEREMNKKLREEGFQ